MMANGSTRVKLIPEYHIYIVSKDIKPMDQVGHSLETKHNRLDLLLLDSITFYLQDLTCRIGQTDHHTKLYSDGNLYSNMISHANIFKGISTRINKTMTYL
jgi:hypothetical protein